MDLRPYSKANAPSDLSVSVNAKWTGSVLSLSFQLSGASVSDLQNLIQTPESHRKNERKDELWQTTCFEAFIMPEWHPNYWEMNFAADGSWNLYRFQNYREGQTRPGNVPAPQIKTKINTKSASLTVSIDFSEEPELLGRTLRFSPAVVIETKKGEKSYWSLEHRQEKPDFHHSDHFVVTLDPENNL